MLEDKIKHSSLLALSEHTRQVVNLAYAQKEKIREQEQTIRDLEQERQELSQRLEEVEGELSRLMTAQSLLGQGTDTEKAKQFIDEVLAKLRNALALVQSLEVADYKEERQ